jgi:hypothetical protein
MRTTGDTAVPIINSVAAMTDEIMESDHFMDHAASSSAEEPMTTRSFMCSPYSNAERCDLRVSLFLVRIAYPGCHHATVPDPNNRRHGLLIFHMQGNDLFLEALLGQSLGNDASPARQLLDAPGELPPLCDHHPTYDHMLMTAINEILEGHGIETVRPRYDKRASYEYINMGDTYNATILLRSDGRLIVARWGS